MEDTVEVVEWDPRWPARFVEARDEVAAATGVPPEAIVHVGSTAVPGLAAKPTIDLMVGVPRLDVGDTVRAALGNLGYAYLGEYGIPGRHFFRRGRPPTHHVHWVRRDGDFWQKQLLFRDYLRAHPADAEGYACLKRDMAARFRHDRAAYTASKTEVVTMLLERAWRWCGAPLVVFDLEATCWEGDTPPERMETIEIGAVRLGPDLAPQAEFQRFVRPEAALSAYCTQLTGIRQADVDAAASFPEVLDAFVAWVGPPPVRGASWSSYDLRQLRQDCVRHARDLPAMLESHLDVQALYARRRSGRRVPMTTALAELGLAHEGPHHRALDDARNIARIAAHLVP